MMATGAAAAYDAGECRRALVNLSNFYARRFDSPFVGAMIGIPATLWLRALRRLRQALPQSCALCMAASGNGLLCGQCLEALPRIFTACPLCALPSSTSAICGACLARAPPFTATIAAWTYAFPVDQLLQAFKYA